MKARVTFIMDVPTELMFADNSGINVNALAEAVYRDLPVKWNAYVTQVTEKETPTLHKEEIKEVKKL